MKKILNKDGKRLLEIKDGVLNGTISEDLLEFMLEKIVLLKNIKNEIKNNDLLLNDFEEMLKNNKKYCLNEVEIAQLEMNSQKDQYELALVNKGLKKFTLDTNYDSVKIIRFIRIGANYLNNFFGISEFTDVKDREDLEKFRPIFIKGKLNQVGSVICEKVIKNVIPKTQVKHFNVSKQFISYKLLCVSLTINLDFAKNQEKNISKMIKFINICDEMELIYLNKDLYL